MKNSVVHSVKGEFCVSTHFSVLCSLDLVFVFFSFSFYCITLLYCEINSYLWQMRTAWSSGHIRPWGGGQECCKHVCVCVCGRRRRTVKDDDASQASPAPAAAAASLPASAATQPPRITVPSVSFTTLILDSSKQHVAVCSQSHHLPYEIDHTVLTAIHPAQLTFPPLTQPINAGTRFSNPGGMQG